MEASKSLRRPVNWQDFESLCKKLWGEIWNCPEIKKNGRNGQAQNGVDIYGIPLGESNYYGIQCKGKSEYTNSQFTEEEIVKEIENAEKFQPPLKKLYFVTTASKDARIEEFVRKKNIENKSKSLFEVHIFSWEDIVDLIDENKQTHDWYLKNQNYKTNKKVLITFQNGDTEITLQPKFKKIFTNYRQKAVYNDYYSEHLMSMIAQVHELESYKTLRYASFNDTTINLSYCKIYLQIHNEGTDPIEEFKLFFEFAGEISDLAESNEKKSPLSISLPNISDVILSTSVMSYIL